MAQWVRELRSGPIGRFLSKYQADDADTMAALIAYSAIFALFPLLLGLLGLLGLILGDRERMATLVEAVQRLFPAQVTELLAFLQETRQLSGVLSLISLAGLVWSGSALFGGMARAFNRFYGVPDRSFVQRTIMQLSMIVIFVALVVLSLLASGLATYLASTGSAVLPAWMPGLGVVQSLVGWAVAIVAAVALFLAIYRVVPNAPLRLSQVWPGALLSAGLFFIINQSFPLYLRLFGGGFEAYKTLGLFLLLVTWFYLLARILVVGAELNAFLNPLPGRHPLPGQTASAPAIPAAARAGMRPRPSLVIRPSMVLVGLALAIGWMAGQQGGGHRPARS